MTFNENIYFSRNKDKLECFPSDSYLLHHTAPSVSSDIAVYYSKIHITIRTSTTDHKEETFPHLATDPILYKQFGLIH